MKEWNTELGAILAAANLPWYATDAQFAWSTLQDTDTAAVDPTLGNALAKQSTGAATVSGKLWDMTSAMYSSTTGLAATISMDIPILVAMVVDKNNHGNSLNTLDVFGNNGVDSIAFGTSSSVQPRFVVSVNSVVTQILTQNSWSAKGTALVHWVFFDRSNATDTIRAGTNSTQNATSGVVALASGRTMSRNVTKGNASGSTGVAFTKEGPTLVLGRAGMTFADAMAIVAGIKSYMGI